jgi:hypothetical protein
MWYWGFMATLSAISPVLSRVLALTAIVGLLLAPVTRLVMAIPVDMQAATSEQMSGDSKAGAMDDMPCCPGKPSLPDCDKDCPFTALCSAVVLLGVSQSGLPLPPTLAAVILPGDPSALVSLAHAPPRKPPKA